MLLIIDPNNDFADSRGSLYVPNADKALKAIAHYIEENIALSAPLLQDVSNVIIVSDAFHLARAEWLVNRHLKGKNVQFYASDSCGDSTPNYLRKLSREIPAWIKAMIMHR